MQISMVYNQHDLTFNLTEEQFRLLLSIARNKLELLKQAEGAMFPNRDRDLLKKLTDVQVSIDLIDLTRRR